MIFEELLSKNENILLVNPPIQDFRLPWASWHLPTGLLQVATYLKFQNKQTKLIDCLESNGTRISRIKIGERRVDGYKLDKWHFGTPFEKLRIQIRKLSKNGWHPDQVLITSMNSIWWEAVRDTIFVIKEELPQVKVILGGAYPQIAYDHAVEYSQADIVYNESFNEVTFLSPDLSLYTQIPYSTGLYFYRGRSLFDGDNLKVRDIDALVEEIAQKSALGIREFLFFDEEIKKSDYDSFIYLLEKISSLKIDSHFIFPGNISPKIITKDMASNFKRANVKQIYFRCDLKFDDYGSTEYESDISDYDQAMKLLLEYGQYKPRDGSIAAMQFIGLPFEDLEFVSEKLIRLAHTVGVIIPIAFQYVPGLHKGEMFDRVLQGKFFSPDEFNSKLYPLGRMSGNTFEDYMELTRLTALLNSRYRSQTFDFLGESLASTLFRDSLKTNGWNPFTDPE